MLPVFGKRYTSPPFLSLFNHIIRKTVMAYSDNNNIVNSNKTDIGNLTSPPSEGLGEVLLSSAYLRPFNGIRN